MRINRDLLNQVLLKSYTVDSLVEGVEQSRFMAAKAELLAKFKQHPVTLELEGGPTARNVSGTLGGRGNLFTFIGFPVDENPVKHVQEILERGLRLVKVKKRLITDGVQFTFRAFIPETELRANTPLPFEKGNSWVYGIEEGISGFSHYVYTRLANKYSRSEHGIQNQSIDFGGTFVPTPYVGEMLRELQRKFE